MLPPNMGEIVPITYHLYYESPGGKEAIRARRGIAVKADSHEKQHSLFCRRRIFPIVRGQ